MTSSTRRFVLLSMLSFLSWSCDSAPTTPISRTSRPPVAAVPTASVTDGVGRVWRQLTETTGLSWTQIAAVCPRDGATPCTGVIGGRDLRGWVWGTAEQVTTLLGQYEPAILTAPSVEGFEQFFTAENFFGSFRPTFSFALTYQAGQHAAGWTSSTDEYGAPIAASVSNGHNMVSVSGSFSVAPVADPDEVSSMRGVFLWHPAGGGVVSAGDDAGSTNTGGGIAVATVLANDSFAGASATLDVLSLSQVSSTDAGVTLDPTDGSVDVAAGTSIGVKQLEYMLCEIAAPTNCDLATVTVTVVPYPIDAVDDAGNVLSTTGGVAVGNVLANDLFNGAPATLGDVTLSLVSASDGLTLDLSDGSVSVAPGTAGGSPSVVYRICETASPSNCDQAAVRVSVTPQSIVASPSKLTVKEGGSGSFTVRLSQQPTSDVVVSATFFQGTTTVTPYPATLTFTSTNWSTPVAVTVQAAKDADKDNNAATIPLSSPGIATVPVVVNVTDVDQPATYPRAVLESPLNGQTVSGTVDLWGTGNDPNGQVVEARFSVDNNRIYRDQRVGTTFRMSGGWNTRTVANGWHTLELRVTDNGGSDGRMTIKVYVSN